MKPRALAGAFRRACDCGRLLGVQIGRLLHVKNRQTWLIIDGRVRVTCGRCGRSTVLGAAAAKETL